jgi:uncharacterized MAPEG superfamily protein
MTTDLQMLVWTALLALLLPAVYAAGRLSRPGGVAWGFGNRDAPLATPPWVDRAVRAHANLVENLPPFIALVVVAHLTGRADDTTALGATIFFWARVAHALIYTAGVVYLRTAAFAVSLVGEGMILSRLLG